MSNITIIASGGTKAPSQLDLADRFIADGHDVRCIATTNALRFLTSHLARRPRRVASYLRLYRPQLRETFTYYKKRPKSVPHVSEGKWADVVVMCPASCNSVGKLTAGMNDNYALLVLRAMPRHKRVIVVPSMNTEMWFDPQFQRNVDLLNATEKYRVLCPERGVMLSGDHGLGAQVSMEEIIEETYAALGLASKEVADALSGRASVPWRTEAPDGAPRLEVAIVDEDTLMSRRLATALLDDYTNLTVHEFVSPAEMMIAFTDRDPALIFTELSFSDGVKASELIDFYRAPGRGDGVQIVTTTVGDRQSAGAEALARRDIYFIPKPLNVNYTVGLIAGCLQGEQRVAAIERRKLQADEVLFEQGDSGETLYLVESGHLCVIRTDMKISVEVRTIGRGQLAGAMSLFNEGIRTATVKAGEPTTVLAIKVEHSWEFIARQPEWLRTLIDTLADRVRHHDDEQFAAALPLTEDAAATKPAA